MALNITDMLLEYQTSPRLAVFESFSKSLKKYLIMIPQV